MTAQEAKTRADRKNSKSEQLSKIIRKIENAASRGLYVLHTDENITEATQKELERLGYTVSQRFYGSDDSYQAISWQKE